MSTNPPESLYARLDKQTKRAAEEWFMQMAPKLEEGGKTFVKERGYEPEQEGVYFEIVHPILMWRFYVHIALVFAQAAEGWQEVVVQTGIKHGIKTGEEEEEEKEEEEKTYSIKRFYQEEGRGPDTIETGLSLQEVKDHCQQDHSSGDGWFDGWTEE